MKKIIFAVICAVLLLGMVATGHAEREDWRGGIRSRISEAKHKIEAGIDHRTLTEREARRLRKELDNILRKIDLMKEDGRLSQKELEKINSDLDRLDRDIAREKHDHDMRH